MVWSSCLSKVNKSVRCYWKTDQHKKVCSEDARWCLESNMRGCLAFQFKSEYLSRPPTFIAPPSSRNADNNPLNRFSKPWFLFNINYLFFKLFWESLIKHFKVSFNASVLSRSEKYFPFGKGKNIFSKICTSTSKHGRFLNFQFKFKSLYWISNLISERSELKQHINNQQQEYPESDDEDRWKLL